MGVGNWKAKDEAEKAIPFMQEAQTAVWFIGLPCASLKWTLTLVDPRKTQIYAARNVNWRHSAILHCDTPLHFLLDHHHKVRRHKGRLRFQIGFMRIIRRQQAAGKIEQGRVGFRLLQ
jgi:hypothetical protein